MRWDALAVGFVKAKARAVRAGKGIARTPIGYLKNADQRLAQDPAVAPLIREVFERRAAGEGPSELGRFLESHGVRTSQGGNGFSKQAVASLLKSRVYLGEIRWTERAPDERDVSGNVIRRGTIIEVHVNREAHEPILVRQPGPDDPTVVICIDEFGPLNLQPHPGRQRARRADCEGRRRRRRRATYKRPHGVRHLLAAYDLRRDRLYGHIKTRKGRTEFLAFCRYIRSLYPPEVRLAFVLDNFSPHLTTKTDSRVGDWATDNNVELAYVPFYASWLNRIQAQFTGLRYFAPDGTDHPDHRTQGRMIRRYIAWRNRNAHDGNLRRVVNKANVA